MMDTIRANTEINNWVNQYRKIWNFNYKIDSNILFLETLNIVDKFKNTYNGKETKHYIIKRCCVKCIKNILTLWVNSIIYLLLY